MSTMADRLGPTPGAEGEGCIDVMNVAIEPTSSGFLRGPVEQWIDQLTETAADYGISGFLVGGDDPRIADILAHEIAPAVRSNHTA